MKLHNEPTPNKIIQELQRVINRKHWKEVIFCGFGEPTERLDCLLEVTRWIKKYHGTVVRLDTNGHAYLLNPFRKTSKRDVIDELKAAGLAKVSVSLNAHTKEVYNKVCKPEFENAYDNVLQFIKNARGKFDTEITAVTIPEVNIMKLKEMARERGVKFRRRVYEPPFFS